MLATNLAIIFFTQIIVNIHYAGSEDPDLTLDLLITPLVNYSSQPANQLYIRYTQRQYKTLIPKY